MLFFFSAPALIYLALRRGRGQAYRSILADLGWQSSKPVYYLWALVVTALIAGSAALAFRFIPSSLLDDPNVSTAQYASMSRSLGAFLLILLREGFYTALGEEIFFRGLLGGVLTRRAGFWIGNTLQAFFFLLPHLLLLTVSRAFWPVLIVQYLAGWLQGWLFWRSGSILPGWLVHSLTNALGALSNMA